MKNIFILFIVGLSCFSCSRKGWISSDKDVTVYPSTGEANTPGTVKIKPLKSGIFEITACADKSFKSDSSLSVLPGLETANFEVKEDGDFIVIKSDESAAKISKITGKVQFLDPAGNLIVQEKPIGGKTLEPMEVDGTKGYVLRQIFDSQGNEALYGLGQHQAGEINYKGKNEELFQYNTKVSVPFIVSTKNYGILWDNYSLTRFGDPRPYKNLDQFILYDKKGEKGGLTATYIDNNKTGHVFKERKENTIDYENTETIKNFPQGFNFNFAQINWEGQIEANESGIYRFLAYYAGYTKVWIDDSLKFFHWRTAWNPSVAKFNVEMEKGTKHKIKVEWIPDGGVSYVGLKALSPVASEEQNQISFYSEMGDVIRYYYMPGKSIDDVISKYRYLTGKAQVMPKWAMGFWQSRERYKTQDELLGVLAEFRKRHIPIDNIVLDWSYWPQNQWGSHDFEASRFPNPKAMVDSIHKQNARIMISVWPKFYINTDNYKAFDKNGWIYKQAVKDSIHDWIAQGYIGSFYDAYNKDARKLFWEQINEKIYSKGFDAWWMDASEPDIQSNSSLPYRKALINPTALGPSTKYFNAYALMNAKGIYEGQRSVNNNDRVFILTRSGFAGIQRYGAATWSGDIGTCWEDMKAQIPAGINFAMAGLPYWTMDIGGFCVQKKFENAREGSEELDEWRELNTRWFQFGSFVPLFRVHGQFPFREVFNVAPESHPAYKSQLYYNKLRYSLMPYIYSITGLTWLDDYTIMRGLAMDFESDKKVYNIGDQFMFGPSLMVCPVLDYKARKRNVYLPQSKGWYNAYSGEYLDGGQSILADAPYEKIPLFVKSGSILTIGPEIEYTGQKPADPIIIQVYTGNDASFKLYEDEGINYNYEKGKYTVIPLVWNEASKTLTIGKRKGEYDGMLKERTFKIAFASKENKLNIDCKNTKYQEVKYTGGQVEIKYK
jgi:alpha-D-xyloside xylohydrolase